MVFSHLNAKMRTMLNTIMVPACLHKDQMHTLPEAVKVTIDIAKKSNLFKGTHNKK
uniref:Uncharacterized protein n=1 Tax=Rhizophora mucronata TaxID=61149 RepID=A0A2P2NPU5_RHIMU